MKFPNAELSIIEPEVSEKKDKITQIRESISKKITYISEIRNQIDRPDVVAMNVDEFTIWTEKEAEKIFTIFPEQESIQERIMFLGVEIERLTTETVKLDYEKNIIIKSAIERYLKSDPDKLKQYLNEEMGYEELFNVQDNALTKEEQEEIGVLTEKDDLLGNRLYEYSKEKDSLLNEDDSLFVLTTRNFFEKIVKKKEEALHIKKLIEQKSFEDILSYDKFFHDLITEKGDNLQIKCSAYDIVIYINKEEARRFFAKENIPNGWHVSNTPISLVVTEDRSQEEVMYTETHEKGHNKSECLEGAGIHNYVYHDKVVRQLDYYIEKYKKLKSKKTPAFIIQSTLEGIVQIIQSQIKGLNGEISADVENLVKGNFTSFYFHFLNTVESLYNLLRNSVSVKEDKELNTVLKKEIDNLVAKAAEHVKSALFLSMIARKYHKEEGFFAATLMSPQNMRLAERYLKDELGDEFEFEKSFTTLAPEYVLPKELHHRIYEIDKEYGGNFIHSIFLNKPTRGIIPPKNYISNKAEESADNKYKRFFNFDLAFTKLFQTSGIFNPTELKRFIAFATPERINQLNDEEKKEAIYTLECAAENSDFRTKTFNNFFDIHKSEEIGIYAANIKKLFDILDKHEEGKVFLQEIFETCFYKAFEAALPEDNPGVLRKFIESWNGIEFKLEEYISKTENNYGNEIDVGEILEDLEVKDELKDRIINKPQSTKVFQYILSIS